MRKGLVYVACEIPREKLFVSRESVFANAQIKEREGSRCVKTCQSDLCSCMLEILES